MENHLIQKLRPQPTTTIQSYRVKTGDKPVSIGNTFSKHLEKATSNYSTLTISKHAGNRMDQRKIEIEPHVWDVIKEKVNEAKQKGVNDSLVLLNNAALIVSAKNNTVVTVMDRQEAGEQIFTNIDGTIVLD